MNKDRENVIVLIIGVVLGIFIRQSLLISGLW